MQSGKKLEMRGGSVFFEEVARNLKKDGAFKPAIEALNQALISDPENTKLLFKRAKLYQKQNSHEQAITEFKKLSFANTENAIGELSRYHCAMSYIALGQYGLAKLELRFDLGRLDLVQLDWSKIKSLLLEIDKHFNAEYEKLKLNASNYKDLEQSNAEDNQVSPSVSFKR